MTIAVFVVNQYVANVLKEVSTNKEPVIFVYLEYKCMKRKRLEKTKTN